MGNQQAKLTPGRQWADAPFTLLETPRMKARKSSEKTHKKETGAFAAASEMALVHNMIIRGLNSIYLQAPNIKEKKDVTDFVTYMYSWSLLVHMHHDNEESMIFPLLEKNIGIDGYMEKNVDQHKSFGPGLTAFDGYVTDIRAGGAQFDGAKVQAIIDSFGQVFTQHLREEITTFLDLEQFAEKIDWPHYNKKVEEKAVKEGDTEYELPCGICNMDATFEDPIHRGLWPPIPWFAMQIFYWIYIPKHSEAWRFASCNSKGYPKDLPFV